MQSLLTTWGIEFGEAFGMSVSGIQEIGLAFAYFARLTDVLAGIAEHL